MLSNYLGLSQELYINQGSSYSKEFILTDEYLRPIDLGGYTFVCFIKRYTGVVQEPIGTLCTASGVTLTLTISDSNTRKLIYPRYVFEIVGTSITDASKTKVMFGQVHIINF